jgi:dienelactone hydrolase
MSAVPKTRDLLAVAVILAFVPPEHSMFSQASTYPTAGARAQESAIRQDLDVAWGRSRDGRTLRADIRMPESGGPFPAVVLVHGGRFTSGSEDKMASPAIELATRGYLSMATEYSLLKNGQHVDEAYLGAVLWELNAAVSYLQSRADVDDTRIGMLGSSAGAILTMMVGSRDERVDGIVAWSGHAWDPPAMGDRDSPANPPAPVFMANSRVDEAIPFAMAAEARLAWEQAGGTVELYATDEQVHGNEFWMFADPAHYPANPHHARQRTLQWLATYVK